MSFDVVDVLPCMNKLPSLNTAVILIVGVEGVGKHKVAKAIINSSASDQWTIQIRTATSLPLPEDTTGERPRIDYVVFMIDLTNRLSFIEVERSMHKIDRSYFAGKMTIVATEVKNLLRYVEVDAVTQLADAFDSQILWCDLEMENERTALSKKILRCVEIAAGFMPGVTSLLVESTKYPFQIDAL